MALTEILGDTEKLHIKLLKYSFCKPSIAAVLLSITFKLHTNSRRAVTFWSFHYKVTKLIFATLYGIITATGSLSAKFREWGITHNSSQLEEPLLGTAKMKMLAIASVTDGDPGDTSFIEDSIKELLKARRVLRASYPYGYYLQVGDWWTAFLCAKIQGKRKEFLDLRIAWLV